MSRQTQGSLALVGIIAGGLALTVFLALMAIGGYGFLPAFLRALLVGIVVAAILLFGFQPKDAPPEAEAPPARSSAEPVAAAAPPPAPAPEPTATPEPEPASAPEPVPAPEPTPAPAQAAAPTGVDYDGDGVIEGTDEGSQPATLDGPRDGGADDLKKIKGVGPKLEALLNRLGFYHFDQVASWTSDEVAWVDANLEGFKGRVSRDNWVEQARLLASGEETEFSKKVDKGDVY